MKGQPRAGGHGRAASRTGWHLPGGELRHPGVGRGAPEALKSLGVRFGSLPVTGDTQRLCLLRGAIPTETPRERDGRPPNTWEERARGALRSTEASVNPPQQGGAGRVDGEGRADGAGRVDGGGGPTAGGGG